MTYSRRKFIRNSTIASSSLLFSRQLFAANNKKYITGIQLYSVRDDMKKDPLGTLKQVAAMGYRYVEHANYIERKFYGYSATDFKRLLSDLGMEMKSGHTIMNKAHWDESKQDFTDSWKYTIEDAATAGQQYVISPGLDKVYHENYDDLKRFMEVFNRCGKLCKAAGMTFGYHNHDFEFSDRLNGIKVFDIILENTDPSLVTQQLDIGNMYNAGELALDIVKKYPGRFELMHVKDEIKSSAAESDKYESTILGTGLIPVKQVIDLGKKSGGTLHFIIEQESYQGKQPLESMKENLKMMKQWGY